MPEASVIPSASLSTAGPWRTHLVAAAVLTAAAIAATWSIWDGIFAHALANEEQSHSLLAIPVAVWLVWCRRRRLAGTRPRASVWGPAAIAAGWLLASAGYRSGIDLATGLGALLIVGGAALAALGAGVLRRVLPAAGALLMVLPVPGRLRRVTAGPLQEWSASITSSLLDLVGVPVQQAGNVLTINGVDVAIAEACNGMRMVTALAIVAYAFVFSSLLRPWARIGILALSPILALLVNVLRLTPTALLYGYSSQAAADAFHDLSGWGVLLLAVAALYGTTALLRWLEVPIDAGASRHPPPAPARAASAPARLAPIPALATAALLCSIFVIGGLDAQRPAGVDAYFARVRAAMAEFPYRVGPAVGVDEKVSPGTSRLLRPNAMLQRRYVDPATGSGFGLSVVHCPDARDLLGHYPPVCYPAHGWQPVGSQACSLPGDAEDVPAHLYTYVRPRESGGGPEHTRVVSFFALPAGAQGLSDSMDAVNRAARSPSAAGLGAAHVMISFSGDVESGPLSSTAAAVIDQLRPVLRSITSGPLP